MSLSSQNSLTNSIKIEEENHSLLNSTNSKENLNLEYFSPNQSSLITQKNLNSAQTVKIQPEDEPQYFISPIQEPSNKKLRSKSKTKNIKKGSRKSKVIQQSPQPSFASNLNAKFIEIIVSNLKSVNSEINFRKDYVQSYEIKGQRQNIVILPYLLLDCVYKNMSIMSVRKSQQQKNVIFEQKSYFIQIIKTSYNTFQTIFNNFLDFLNQFGSNKLQKIPQHREKKKQSKYSFIEKELKYYIKITHQLSTSILQQFIQLILRKGQVKIHQLSFLKPTEKIQNTQQQIKIEEFEPSQKQQQECNIKKKQYNNVHLQDDAKQIFQNLFPTKERQIQKAINKFKSIQLSSSILREVFDIPHDFKLPIKNILQKAIKHEHKRQMKLQTKKSLQQHQQTYDYIEKNLDLCLSQNPMIIRKQVSLGKDFLLALMSISMLKEKNTYVFVQFIESLHRHIRYIANKEQISLYYGKDIYIHYIDLISKVLSPQIKQVLLNGFQINKLNIHLNSKTIYEVKEWIYPQSLKIKTECKIEDDEINLSRQESTRLIEQMVSYYCKYHKEKMYEIKKQNFLIQFH